MKELIDLIREKSFRRGSFTLASGATSEYFFDLKPTMLDPTGAVEIAMRVLEKVHEYDCDAVGGLAIGAVPMIATAVAFSSFTDTPLPGFYVRKEAKDHGTQQLIDGLHVAGLNVVLLEDVTTSGGSLLRAATVVRGAGGRVNRAITIVDREEGGTRNLLAHGIALVPIFTLRDFQTSTAMW